MTFIEKKWLRESRGRNKLISIGWEKMEETIGKMRERIKEEQEKD